MSKIFLWNKDKWGWGFFGLAGSIAFGLVTPVFALAYAEIVNVYSQPAEQMGGGVIFWAAIFIILGLVHAGGFFIAVSSLTLFSNATLQAISLGRCGEALTKKLRFETFRSLLRQDVGFYDDLRHGTGKLCTRLATDAPNVRYVSLPRYLKYRFQVFTRLPSVLASLVTICGALGIAFYFGWRLALVLMILLPLIIGSGYVEMKMQVILPINQSLILSSTVKNFGTQNYWKRPERSPPRPSNTFGRSRH